MLPRTLEPEVMDGPEDAADYDAMDHGVVNRLFVADFLAAWNGRSPVLDVGTGTAQIPILLALTEPSAHVIGLDAASEMLRLAAANAQAAGVAERVTLREANARALPFDDRSVPALMSNSIVHHVSEPAAAFAEMARVAAPGATLFVRDLARPADAVTLMELVNRYAADANDHQRRLFADSLHAALTLEEVREIVAALGFDPAGVRLTSDRHWTWAATR